MIYDQYLKIGNSVSQYVDKVLELVSLHADIAFRSKWFTKISKETLIKLLENDSLFIKEKDLYYACLKWINAQLIDEKKKLIPKNQQLLFNEIKNLIRFPIMSKIQFDNGPAKSGLFSLDELEEFEKYFQTKNIKVLSVNYNANERDALPIHKLQYDERKNKFVQVDRFSNSFGESVDGETTFILEDSIDLVEREAMMKKNFGKNYFNDGKRKKKEADSKNKKLKTETDDKVEFIHVFKFQMRFENKEQVEEYWNMELAPEIHVNFNKLQDVQFKKYIESGNFYFSLDKPVALSTAKEFRIAFRTDSNISIHNTFKLQSVITTNDEESKVDVKLKVQDKKIPMADMYFVFKEDYIDTSMMDQSNTSSDTSMNNSKENLANALAEKAILIDSSDEESKENYDIN